MRINPWIIQVTAKAFKLRILPENVPRKEKKALEQRLLEKRFILN